MSKNSQAVRPLVICGGGIAGLALGIQLQKKGLRPLIIEKQKGIVPQVKGEFFQPQGVAVLEKIGLLGPILRAGAQKIQTFSHTYRDPFFRAHTVRSSYQFLEGPDFAVSILHEEILRVMREEFQNHGGELWEGVCICRLSQKEKGFEIKLSDGRVLSASCFVGADGKFSLTRKLVQLEKIELDCSRVMMASLFEDFQVPEDDFYTETIQGGVLYAFPVNASQTRVYLCIDKSELKKANQNRKEYFLERLHQSLIYQCQMKPPHVLESVMMMPTVDCMLKEAHLGTGIWFGDAAGTVDPLAGQGMSVALVDSQKIANVIFQYHQHPAKLSLEFERMSIELKKHYLHSRFVSLWIAQVLTSNRWLKWVTLRKHQKDKKLNEFLIELFSGVNREPLGFVDIPYLLGVFPGKLRNRIQDQKIVKSLLRFQNHWMTTPSALKPHFFSKMFHLYLDQIKEESEKKLSKRPTKTRSEPRVETSGKHPIERGPEMEPSLDGPESVSPAHLRDKGVLGKF